MTYRKSTIALRIIDARFRSCSIAEGCGLLHSLLGIKTKKDLHSHPKLGASLEGHVLERVLAVCGSADFA